MVAIDPEAREGVRRHRRRLLTTEARGVDSRVGVFLVKARVAHAMWRSVPGEDGE
jgi:hypothetical protein